VGSSTVDHLDGASDKDLPGFYRIEKAVIGLVDLHQALAGLFEKKPMQLKRGRRPTAHQ
jgi:hypothetical protein